MDTTTVIAAAQASNKSGAFKTTMTAGDFAYTADEPLGIGGNNEGATPGQYLCMALASCKAITLRMYAARKGWAVEEITVKVSLVKGDQLPSGLNTFYCTIQLAGDLTGEQRKRLLEIASVCPVDRLLGKPSEVQTVLA